MKQTTTVITTKFICDSCGAEKECTVTDNKKVYPYDEGWVYSIHLIFNVLEKEE